MIEYLSTTKQCIGYIGNGCRNRATQGEPKCLCVGCEKLYEELNEKLLLKKDDKSNYIQGESEMVVYECYYQQSEKDSKQCQECYPKEMKEKYPTRAACVKDNAEKKDGDTF